MDWVSAGLGLLKEAFKGLGKLFGFLDRRAIRRDAKDAAYGEQDRETLELVKRVNADVPATVRDVVWRRFQNKHRPKPK
jgi:hypothetical protein